MLHDSLFGESCNGAKSNKILFEGALSSARTVGSYLHDRVNYTSEEFVEASEKAIQAFPNEWIVYYIASDKLADVGRYADSLRAAQRVVELRPNDPHSAYSLASAYYLLARAIWVDSPKFSAIEHLFPSVNPELSKAELAKAGISVETAGVQAIRWFERALALKPNREGQKLIRQSLHALYGMFPDLKT